MAASSGGMAAPGAQPCALGDPDALECRRFEVAGLSVGIRQDLRGSGALRPLDDDRPGADPSEVCWQDGGGPILTGVLLPAACWAGGWRSGRRPGGAAGLLEGFQAAAGRRNTLLLRLQWCPCLRSLASHPAPAPCCPPPPAWQPMT